MSEDRPIEFLPSTPPIPAPASAGSAPAGRRDVGIVFLGASLVAGYGDPKGQGWVTRVIGRSQHPDLDLTAYNLAVRGDTTADVLTRWHTEVPLRWRGRAERRLVVSVGGNDIAAGVSLARHRLGLANLLDDATSAGVRPFVVSPPPSGSAEVNEKLEVLLQAQSDVCSRRGVPFVDCFTPLLGHDQWQSDLAAGDGHHPGQAGYGLIAWLVLHNGWPEWLGVS